MESVVINIHGYEVIISACDYERIMAHKWYKNGTRGGPYFAYKTPAPERKNILLHRFIVDCPLGMCVDHISGNTLDNRRSNLRICTLTENKRNRSKQINSTSGLKGVCWDKHHGKWYSCISVNGKNINLGLFDDPQKAYEAYVAASKKYHGEFGRIA